MITPSNDGTSCQICDSDQKQRIDGWILGGASVKEVIAWCGAEGVGIDAAILDRHEASGHIPFDKNRLIAMLIKYNRDSEMMIEYAMAQQTSRPRLALHEALKMKMRTIEVAAQIGHVLTAPKSVTNVMNVQLDNETKRRMIAEMAVSLPKPDNNSDNNG